MEHPTPPPLRFPTPIACDGCHGMTDAPRWIRTDTREYSPFCLSCLVGLERGFTAAGAIRQAAGICKFHQAVLDGRVK